MVDADCIINGLTDPAGNPVRGPESFKSFHREFCAAYPDLNITIEDLLTDGDKIVGRCRVTGTHEGEAFGLAPKNRPVNFTGILISRIKDNKIVEAWNEFDFVTMYAQLGVLHPPGEIEQNKEIIRKWFD